MEDLVDVGIVGFGPTGAMTALRCAQRGLSVIAIDAATDLYPHPRAIGLDAEGSRLFHTAGLGDALAACSSPNRGAEFLTADRERVVGFELPDGFVGPLGHPPMVMFEQPQLERALRAAAVEAGVDARLGVSATGLRAEGDIVSVETSAEPVVCRWLVGADGASSWVRQSLDIPLEDQGYDQPWLVIDTTLIDPSLRLPELAQQVCDPARITTFVPGHGTRRRWEFRLHDHESRDEMLDPDRIAELLAPWGTPDQLRVDRAAVYRFHALVADRFRLGRVFLAGDAAHQMPPFNGQGMNSGLRDAENLSWKLAAVTRGRASDRLLDTYEAERRPHAVATVEHTCDAGRLIDAIASGIDIRSEDGYGGGRPAPRIEHGLVHDPANHPAVGKPVPQPIVDGRRLDELLGDGFAILRATSDSGQLPTGLDRLGATEVRLPSEAWPADLGDPSQVIVVRPDRIVAAITDDLASVDEQLLAPMSSESAG